MRSSTFLYALPLAALAVSAAQVNPRSHKSRFHRRSSPPLPQGNTPGPVLLRSFAQSQGLAYVQGDNTAVMTVDNYSDLSEGENRNSVRIQSKTTISTGLVIADIFDMPHGCSVWPSLWQVGPNWPAGGEIDIIEGVNNLQLNQMTVHSSEGCTLDKNPPATTVNNTTGKVEAFTSNIIATGCATTATSNAGCAFQDPSTQSYGTGFNDIAGGVFASLVQDSGIQIWRFPRYAIPSDITSQNPDPTTWGAPSAYWSSSSCDISSHFYNMNVVFDITLCGDWAGSAYSQTCGGSKGGASSCAAQVTQASNYKYASWKINYVAIYQ
ncbi:hypothetical protein EW145_g233 [Phellinidium pouzarii]|uniref:GH16 domain-containing protein n=1 Tax=Phellinidium pouzarii TaxID=167371 RepID=A0A4S4LJE2_9AGAM|nr:hypothetical protein EW145_g233 [Phellinidium pouzarii]